MIAAYLPHAYYLCLFNFVDYEVNKRHGSLFYNNNVTRIIQYIRRQYVAN